MNPGLTTLLAITAVIGLLLYLESKGIIRFGSFGLAPSETGDGSEEEGVKIDSPLAEIFYLYAHESEKKWLDWMSNQDKETRRTAAQQITDHLDGHAKHWGYVTLEALECLKGFKDLHVESHVGKFFTNCGALWGEYKSIPNYYQKAAEVMCDLNPTATITLFKSEINKKGNTQSNQEKKKIIIDVLPNLEDNAINTLVSLINDTNETIGTRAYALRKAKKFSDDNQRLIYFDVFNHIVSKYKSGARDMKTDEVQILQDVLKESVKMVSKLEFFDIFTQACDSRVLQDYAIESLILNLIDNDAAVLTTTDLFAMTRLTDNSKDDLRRALSRKQNLSTAETNNLAVHPIIESIDRDSLIKTDIMLEKLPIPEILAEQFEDFKSYFTKANVDQYNSCDKDYGGVLITGDESTEKMYLSKAVAQDKKYNFGYINMADVTNKESYSSVVSIFSTLRKPYMLYIDNPDLLYDNNSSSDAGQYRHKFVQTLYVQALDNKSLLVGDIPHKKDEFPDEDIKLNASKLRNKFFAQEIEINQRPDNVKFAIAEEYLKHVSGHRFDNKKELCAELVEKGNSLSFLEFIYFIIDTYATMLLVFGKNVPYKEIEELTSKLIGNAEDEKESDAKADAKQAQS